MASIAITGRRHSITLAVVIMLVGVFVANKAGLIIGNPTTSVPRGLYYAVSPEDAEYISFCLDHRHADHDYYDEFCSTDRLRGLRILKRIAERRPDGSLIVRGDSPEALDSRLLGPVLQHQIRAWWKPLIQIDTAADMEDGP